MTFKKLNALALAVLLLFTLSSCAQKSDSPNDFLSTPESLETAPPEATPTPSEQPYSSTPTPENLPGNETPDVTSGEQLSVPTPPPGESPSVNTSEPTAAESPNPSAVSATPGQRPDPAKPTPSKPETVNSIPVSEISLGFKEKTMILYDETLKINPTIIPANATDKSLTYKSSDHRVIEIYNENVGEFDAVRAGTATITVTASNGIQASFKITVIIPVENVYVVFDRSTYKVGDTVGFTAWVFPYAATDQSFSIDVSGAGGTLIGNNSVLCKSSGKLTITATASNGVVGKSEIDVIDLNEFADAIRIEFYKLINQHRKDNGLKELTVNRDLQVYADLRAAEQRTVFGHTRPDGSAAGSGWFDSQNYVNTRYAENALSVGNLNLNPKVEAKDIFESWRNSEGHNRHFLWNFGDSITMALGLALEMDGSGRITSGAIWASGY
jgi:uncharacterized protein YjdB